MREIRVYDCGCVDTHDSELWGSTCVDHCKAHSWTGEELTQSWENPAAFEGIPYTVREED